MKYGLAILLLQSILSCTQAQQPHPIRLNQEGYYTNGPKWAAVTGDLSATDFYLIDAAKKDTVYTGRLSDTKQSTNSSLQTKLIDFSVYTRPGRYQLIVKNAPPSHVFTIGKQVHHVSTVALLKGYYYQRVSMPLQKEYAGQWARPAGHPDTAVIIHAAAASPKRKAGSIISAPGGWYDAGDYNKYIVNSGITMGTLLSAYEDFTPWFDTLRTNIPESQNRLPDLLDEVLYNLRWMLTMQDPNDGGVYNKCTNANFDGMVMPGVTKEARYVVQKGTAATLDFAAVMAQAARIYKKYNKQLPGLSDSCLKAAEQAWRWAQSNPALPYNQDSLNKVLSPAVTTGGYGDRNFSDEWFWAASELYLTTRKKSYLQVIEKDINKELSLPSWANVQMLGYYSLLRVARKDTGEKTIELTPLKQRLLAMADKYLTSIEKSAFYTVMGQSKSDYVWGSSSVAANQGVLLINACLLSHDPKYLQAAITNLDYLLGRNATGYSFVTGIGAHHTMHPHHRPSVADGIAEPVPGLLAGGPNPGRQDRCVYPYTEPETAYSDTDCSYASNEIAINWNAPAVYLFAAIEAIAKNQ